MIRTVTPTDSNPSDSLQSLFLRHVRTNQIPLTVFLINGVKLQGIITWYDNFCVLLRREEQVQMIYKHAISTIMPQGKIFIEQPNGQVEQD